MNRKIIFVCIVFAFPLLTNAEMHKFKYLKLNTQLQERAIVLEYAGQTAMGKLPPLPGNEFQQLQVKILRWLSPRYRQIGVHETDNIIKQNKKFSLGSKNYRGFTWQKPMGVFVVGVNRIINPPRYRGGRFTVKDYFTISLGAVSFIKYLKRTGAIDIGMQNIGAFAGLGFQRTYKFVHYADTYMKGATADFRKLFLAFTYFTNKKILKMEENETLFKGDFFSFDAGVYAKTPNFYGTSARMAFLAGTHRMAGINIKSYGVGDNKAPNAPLLDITSTKSNGKSLGAFFDVGVDFFNLLKLTLFSFNISYDFDTTHNFTLRFRQEDKDALSKGGSLAKDFKKILKLRKANMDVMEGFLINREYRNSNSKSERHLMLYKGWLKKRDETHVQLVKNKKITTFFENKGKTTSYKISFWKEVANNVIKKFKDLPIKIDPLKDLSHEEVTLQYRAKRDQGIGGDGISGGDQRAFANEMQLSFSFLQEYDVTNTLGKLDKKYKGAAVEFLEGQTNLEEKIISALREDTLRGPVTIISKVQIDRDGIGFLNGLLENDVLDMITSICHKKYKNKKPRKYKKKFKKCYNKITKSYAEYKDSFSPKRGVDVKKFKKFLRTVQKFAPVQMYLQLFGFDNVFFNGEFSAKTSKGRRFKTYFKGGNPAVSGLIEQFKSKKDNW